MRLPLLSVVLGVAAVSHAAPTRVPNDQQLVIDVTYDPFYDNAGESLTAIACSGEPQVSQSELDTFPYRC